MTSSPSTDSVSQNAIAEIRAELELDKAEAQNLAHEGLSANTRRLYESDWRELLTWVQRAQAGNSQLSTLPATDETLALYIGAHVDIKPSTLARRLAAMRLMHRWSGYKSPFEQAPNFTVVYTGYKRRWSERRPSKLPQSAATEPIISKLVDDQPVDTLIGLRNRTLLLVGFDAALRGSELVGIDVEHLAPHPEGLALHLPNSKSDQEGRGSTEYLLSRPNSSYCPVRSLVDWLATAQINEGPVFRTLHHHGKSLILGVDRLSDKAVYRLVKRTALDLGIPSRFGAHSLRRGLITSAMQNKRSICSVQQHARHKTAATASWYNETLQGLGNHLGSKLLNE